jgi:hypothetical protein
VLNVTGVLEQTLTPFRGPETGAPDLLQTRSQPSYVDTTKIDQRSLASNVDAGQGDTPAVGVPPCNPSGRQDLNLRPLDPQMTHQRPPAAADYCFSSSTRVRGPARTTWSRAMLGVLRPRCDHQHDRPKRTV